MCSEYLGQWIW